MKKFDLVVVGGGFTGTAAAVAAARQGLSVLIIEKSGALGGAANTCLVNPFMGNSTKIEKDGNKERLDLSRGIFSEIFYELNKLGALEGLAFHEEYLKLILDRMIKREDVKVLYHAFLSDVEVEDKKIIAVNVATKAGKLRFEADYFIDATGDADLAVLAGFPYRLGRDSDNLCQPMTLCFRVGNIDIPRFRQNIADTQEMYKKLQQTGEIKNPRENILFFRTHNEGVIHFNTTRVVKHNPVDPFEVSEAEMIAREQVFEMVEFLRKYAKGCENCQLIFTASEIGVRESRMIIGEHILTESEIKDCTVFEDAIAACNYDIDIHNPEGSGTSHYYFPDGEYYTIPYRSLQPKDTVNLLVAGRCISSTHEAQASYRIMPTVCCLGEAAGVAVSVAKHEGVSVKEADIKAVQHILVDNGAFIGENVL